MGTSSWIDCKTSAPLIVYDSKFALQDGDFQLNSLAH
jgi:hypothetical protein